MVRCDHPNVVRILDSGEARDLLRNETQFDLVFCDLMMNGVTGMDIAEAAETYAPQNLERMVFMTGGAYTPKAREFVRQYEDRSVDKIDADGLHARNHRLHESGAGSR